MLTFPVFAQSGYVFKFGNSDSLDVYIKKDELLFHPEDVYIVKDFESFKEYTQASFFRSPMIYVFNKEGDYLERFDNMSAERKLSNFKRIRNKPDKDKPNLDFWTQKIAHYKSGAVFEDSHLYNYTFVINWGYLLEGGEGPKIVKILNEWYKVLLRQKASGKDIKIIMLNIDLQDHWNLSQTWRDWVLEQINKK